MVGNLMTDQAALLNSETIGKSRIFLIDQIRGWAIVAMAIFHFTWDLEFFGFVEPGLTATIEWKTFARSIASSFLYLAGLSLVLGQDPIIRYKSFAKRLGYLIIAAALISIATYAAMPNAPIFFGILHSIAAASIVGLIVRRLPSVVLIILAVLVFLAPMYFRSEFFDAEPLWWVGLNATIPRSNDYVPLLPWLAPFLIGMAFAKIARKDGLFDRLIHYQSAPKNLFTRGLDFIGRHSLATYIIHQPLLFGLVWVYWTLFAL
jgi:uncharacterized membrane protein